MPFNFFALVFRFLETCLKVAQREGMATYAIDLEKEFCNFIKLVGGGITHSWEPIKEGLSDEHAGLGSMRNLEMR